MLLNKFFDKIYVITCDFLLERHLYIKNHFKEKNIKFEYKSAVTSRLFKSHNTLTETEISLVNAHLHCIIDAKLNKYKNILICEDDVSFIDDVHNQFFNFIKRVPKDWDFLQLGNNADGGEWLAREKIKDNLYQFKWGTGSYCIGINSKVYDICISNFSRFDNPPDFSYYKLYKNLKAFCPERFLADSISFRYYNNSFAHIFESTVDHSCISNYI